MKEVILHVGFHKTATSSIQSTLFENRYDLTGFCFPVFKRGSREIINHSVPFYSLYCDDPYSYQMNKTANDNISIEDVNESYKLQLISILDNNNKIIFSGEDISMLPENKLEEIRDLFYSKGFSLKVYCSVRRPYSFLCSELQERVKAGFQSLDRIKVHKKSEDAKKLKRVFGENVTFFNFESDLSGDGVVINFMNRIGLNSENIKLSNQNEGIDNFQVRLLDFLNENLSNLGGRLSLVRALSKLQVSEKFLLTNSELLKISDALDFENKCIRDILGENYCDTDYNIASPCLFDIKNSVFLYKALRVEMINSKKIIDFIAKNSVFNMRDYALEIHDVDVYRDVAVLYEKEDLNIAFFLMSEALKIRPQGPFINKKIKEYEALLKFEALNG